MRKRVASSDWCASRNVVSVSNSCFLLQDPLANFSGPSCLNFSRLPSGIGCLASKAEREPAARLADRPVLHQRIAVDDRVGQKRQQPRRPVAAALRAGTAPAYSSMKRRRASPRQELRVRHELDQERNVHLHAADAEFLQAALHAAGRVDETPPRAVTFTNSES